jgi:hypothetical protein
VIDIQDTALEAVQVHPGSVVTLTIPVPVLAGADVAVGVTA